MSLLGFCRLGVFLPKYYANPKRGSTAKKADKQYERISSRLSIYVDDRITKKNWIEVLRLYALKKCEEANAV